jgi:gluconate 5-dehydrogenase/2-deoxy-D-gluconate 3-dehydrogenase
LANVSQKIKSHFGNVDILINAAGLNPRIHADEVTKKIWNETLDINLSAPFFLAQQMVPAMKESKWGRIINFASLQSERAFENGISYGTAKGGVMQMTRAMAQAWSKDGITVNAIAPGFFPTELTASVFANEALANQNANQTCIGRNGTMDDLTGPVQFLCSNASAYITGQTLYVDGGFTAK